MNNNRKTYILSLDSQCNQRCLICMKKMAIDNKRPLTEESVAKEIKSAKKRGFGKIDFYGGEPLTYPFLAKSIKLANGLSLQCFLATNATKFSSRNFARAFLADIKIKEMRTTLHASSPALHDRITRVRGSFKKTIRGIRNILDLKRTNISVNVVINSLNYTGLDKMASFILGLGVKNITFSGLVLEGELTRHPGLLVDLALIQPHLNRAMTKCLASGAGAKIIKLPVCILNQKLRRPLNCINEINHNFNKLAACPDCRYNGFCPGVPQYQMKAFGTPSFLDYV
ncbi:MAG TPA: hypothetical protein DCL35_02665 [Candidatus Omnitrophica bacterium]|nr:hypothetical protein [Candidatus Omnitrophota bacterium]